MSGEEPRSGEPMKQPAKRFALQGLVSVVVPAHNEQLRLPATLRTILEFGTANPGSIEELIVVDDGSDDATVEVVRSFTGGEIPVRILSYRPNRGKGHAIRRGVLAARADAVLISDADLSTPIYELRTLDSHLEEHPIVIGSRAIDESLVRVRQAWLRQTMGKTFNRLVRLITGLPFLDTQCGFKLLRSDVARKLFGRARVDGFAWDVEILLLAREEGFSVAEIPVEWVNSPDSRVRIVRDSLRMLRDVIELRWRLRGPAQL